MYRSIYMFICVQMTVSQIVIQSTSSLWICLSAVLEYFTVQTSLNRKWFDQSERWSDLTALKLKIFFQNDYDH